MNCPPVFRALLLGAAVIPAACDDGIGPAVWDPTPDTTLIYSLSRPDLIGQPSAYDFVRLRRLAIEAPGETGSWDIVLAEQNGAFVVIPSSWFPGLSSRSGVGRSTDTDLESVTRAPGDSAFYRREPVPLAQGAVYVVRTRTDQCYPFGVGATYAKFQVVSMDAAAGAVRLAAVRNPYCNNRDLIPEK